MALFRYQALSPLGKTLTGILHAHDLAEAKASLLRQKQTLLSIQPFVLRSSSHLSKKELLLLTRELHRLLHEGLPLFEALSILEEKYTNQKPHPILLDLCHRVQSGEPFSRALAAHAGTFDLLYSAMVAHAEKGTRLEYALQTITTLLEKQIHLRKQLLDALIYPAILAGFCLMVLSSLLFFVIPSLADLFANRPLHPFTAFVFTCSRVACESQGILLALVAAIAATITLFVLSPVWKRKLQAAFMRLPLLKNIALKAAWARFCRATAALLEGGVPVVEAFAQGRSVMKHPALERSIEAAEGMIASGSSLSKSLGASPLIPALVPRMLGVAEEGGTLPFMMQQIAQIYEEELEKSLQSVTTIGQPLLLLLLGALVGFVLLSVLLPLTDVESFMNF